MKYKVCLGLAALYLINAVSAEASGFKSEDLGNGFYAIYQQDDPFDPSKKKYDSFSKGQFVFNCKWFSFWKRNKSFDSFSFHAEIALKVDENEPIHSKGTYSTYQFGSDMVSDDRMYTVRMWQEIVQKLKDGNTLKASGKFGKSGWEAFEVSLRGFTNSYNKVCN